MGGSIFPKQPGLWSVEDRLHKWSAKGDPLEKLLEIVDFELSRPVLDEALDFADRPNGGRQPCDAVSKFNMLYLACVAGCELRAD